MPKMFVAFILIVCLGGMAHGRSSEPQCSQFDFVERTLEKVIKSEYKMVEFEQKINNTLRKLEDITGSKIEEMARLEQRITDGLEQMEDVAKSKVDHLTELEEMINGTLATVDYRVQAAITELSEKVTRHGGSTYIRWGRRSCPNDTNAELVYEGYVAGGHFTHTGAGSNYLCLPRDPLFVDDITSGSRGLLYGTEYETSNTPFANIHDHDALCAVCRSPRPNDIMILGRNQCYNKWQLEYSGMLVSSHFGHVAQYDYACLDSEPETINAGHGDANGALCYLVEGRCGSLKCPPYIEYREITCVVCTYTG